MSDAFEKAANLDYKTWYIAASALASDDETYEPRPDLDALMRSYESTGSNGTGGRWISVDLKVFNDNELQLVAGEDQPDFSKKRDRLKIIDDLGVKALKLCETQNLPSGKGGVISADEKTLEIVRQAGGVAIHATPDTIHSVLVQLCQHRSLAHQEERAQKFGGGSITRQFSLAALGKALTGVLAKLRPGKPSPDHASSSQRAPEEP